MERRKDIIDFILLILIVGCLTVFVFSSLKEKETPDISPQIELIEDIVLTNDRLLVAVGDLKKQVEDLGQERIQFEDQLNIRLKELETFDYERLYRELGSYYDVEGNNEYIINENQVKEIVYDKVNYDFTVQALTNCEEMNLLNKKIIDDLTVGNDDLRSVVLRNKEDIILYQSYIDKQKKKNVLYGAVLP